jgi:hypothetical protein
MLTTGNSTAAIIIIQSVYVKKVHKCCPEPGIITAF